VWQGSSNDLIYESHCLITCTTTSLAHAPTMVALISNNQLFDDRITGLPIHQLRASHDTHQNQTRMGVHEEIPCLQQEIGVAAIQTSQDTGAVDTSGVPPYLKRKLLMRHAGMSCNLVTGFTKKLTAKKQQTGHPTTVTGSIRTIAMTKVEMRRSCSLDLE